MKITKLEHSGLLVENNGYSLVCDPVEINEKLPVFSNVSVIVITHEHFDHYRSEIVAKIRETNPSAKIFTTERNATAIPDATAVVAGDIVNVDGFDLHFFGADHAEIFPGVVPCQNIGVVINGAIANPGDSFDVPPEKIDLLCVPLAAPWCKVKESVDYIQAVKPRMAIPFHDAVLSDFGSMINNNCLKSKADDFGVDYRLLRFGESIEL